MSKENKKINYNNNRKPGERVTAYLKRKMNYISTLRSYDLTVEDIAAKLNISKSAFEKGIAKDPELKTMWEKAKLDQAMKYIPVYMKRFETGVLMEEEINFDIEDGQRVFKGGKVKKKQVSGSDWHFMLRNLAPQLFNEEHNLNITQQNNDDDGIGAGLVNLIDDLGTSDNDE